MEGGALVLKFAGQEGAPPPIGLLLSVASTFKIACCEGNRSSAGPLVEFWVFS